MRIKLNRSELTFYRILKRVFGISSFITLGILTVQLIEVSYQKGSFEVLSLILLMMTLCGFAVASFCYWKVRNFVIYDQNPFQPLMIIHLVTSIMFTFYLILFLKNGGFNFIIHQISIL